MKREHRNRTDPQVGQGHAPVELARHRPGAGGRKQRRSRHGGASNTPGRLPTDQATRHARRAMNAARKVATIARSGDEAAQDAAGLRVCKHLLALLDSPTAAGTRRSRSRTGPHAPEVTAQETPAQAWARSLTGVSRTGVSLTCESRIARVAAGDGEQVRQGVETSWTAAGRGRGRGKHVAERAAPSSGQECGHREIGQGRVGGSRVYPSRGARDGGPPVQISLALF